MGLEERLSRVYARVFCYHSRIVRSSIRNISLSLAHANVSKFTRVSCRCDLFFFFFFFILCITCVRVRNISRYRCTDHGRSRATLARACTLRDFAVEPLLIPESRLIPDPSRWQFAKVANIRGDRCKMEEPREHGSCFRVPRRGSCTRAHATPSIGRACRFKEPYLISFTLLKKNYCADNMLGR